MSAPDFLSIVVPKRDILTRDVSPTLALLRTLIESPETARHWHEKVDLAIDGYNDSTAELFELTEVRAFIHALDAEFPYWLYFLSKRHLGLQCIAYCFLPPFLTPKAQREDFPRRLHDLLTRRWFPALNQIAAWVGMTDEELEALSDRSAHYLVHGRQRP